MSDIIRVGMADFKLCRSPQKISTLGLGSCLGVVLYDRTTKICGLAHVMMPASSQISQNANRMKFVDTCIPDMYEELLRVGAKKSGIIAKMAGGAKMFSYQSNKKFLNIGQQNVEAVHEVLGELRIPILAEDVGSNYGRTIEFDTVTGGLSVKAVGIGDSII